MIPLQILIVDDEPLARRRLRELLDDLALVSPNQVVGEAASGVEALACLQARADSALPPVDVVLADIHMPDMDGLELAKRLRAHEAGAALIFTTAYEQHAVRAFELSAVDYLLKPVRALRLQNALDKVRKARQQVFRSGVEESGPQVAEGRRTHLPCHERGGTFLVPVAEILYFRAELKYVIARTPAREYVLEEALAHLEQEFAGEYLRLHRSILVARHVLVGLERAHAQDGGDAYGWARICGVAEKLPVSRRQWSSARTIIEQTAHRVR